MILYDKNGFKLDLRKFKDSDVAGNRKKEILERKKTYKSLFFENGNGVLLKIFTINSVGKKLIGDNVFNPRTFESIKEVNNPSIVKLYDYYYNPNLRHDIDAYTMEKIYSKKIDLLSEDKETLLCYLSDLQKLANDLTNKGIRMQDPNGANLLFNDRGPVVVDLDYFDKHAIYSKNELETWNKSMILNYLHNYSVNNYSNSYGNKDQNELVRGLNDLNGIFAMKLNSKTDIVEGIKNNLYDSSISRQLKLKRTR